MANNSARSDGSYPQFHISIGVNSIEQSVDFYSGLLNGRVAHRDPSGYVNIELYGCELTLKPTDSSLPELPDFHFGVNLSMAQFNELAESVMKSGYERIVMQPKVVDSGTPIERKKMYLRCPTGYLIELKGYNG